MKLFLLTIALLAPDGKPLPVPVLPTEHATHRACLDAMIATYATPMGKYRIVGARCEVKP